MLRKGLLLLSVVILNGCVSGNANYPPLEAAFGKVQMLSGSVEVTREGQSLTLEPGADVYVGDTVLTAAASEVDIRLAPGQSVRLGSQSSWQITDVLSNGAAYGSDTYLATGRLKVTGKEYMPHRIIVRTPEAVVTTYSENFSVVLGPGESVVQSLDEVQIRVSSSEREVVLKQALDVVTMKAEF